MFSPSRVRIVLIPAGLSAFAASIASSTRSPGMNFFTERRTNCFLVAVSRIHALVDAQRKTLRIIDMKGSSLTSAFGIRHAALPRAHGAVECRIPSAELVPSADVEAAAARRGRCRQWLGR